jgi:hypothetical protein
MLVCVLDVLTSLGHYVVAKIRCNWYRDFNIFVLLEEEKKR